MVVVAALFLPAVALGLVVKAFLPRLFPGRPGVGMWIDRYWPWIPLVVVAGLLAAVAWQAAVVSVIAFAAGWRYRHRVVMMHPARRPSSPER